MSQVKGIFAILIAMFIFGSMGIFVRFTGQSGLVVASVAFMVSSVCLLPLLLKKGLLNRSLLRKESYLLFFIAVAGVANNVSYFMAFQKTTIASAVFFHYLAPVFAVIMAYFILGENFTFKKGMAIVASVIGLLFVSELSFSGSSAVGNVLALVSAVAYASSLLLYKKAMQYFDNLVLIFAQMFLGALLMSPLFFTTSFSLTLSSLGFLLIIGFVHQFVAVLFHMYGIRALPVSVSAIVGYTEILFALVFGFIFFKEIPSLFVVIGGICIVIATVLIIEWKNSKNVEETIINN
jgi:drug/metabolite transporter (DMT)-like permease